MLHNPNYFPNFVTEKEICMKQKKKEMMMQEYGKYFLDLSKLIFGGIILTGIMGLQVNSYALFGLGLMAVSLFAMIGFKFYHNSK